MTTGDSSGLCVDANFDQSSSVAENVGGIPVYLSAIQEWMIEFGYSFVSISVRTDISWYRLGRPSKQYAAWYKPVLKTVRLAIALITMLNNQSRASRLSFADVIKKVSKFSKTNPAYISSNPTEVERYVVVHGHIILQQFAELPNKRISKCAFVSGLFEKMEERRHTRSLVKKQVYYSKLVLTVPVTGVEGKCDIRKKHDLAPSDSPTIFEHIFFCEHLYDPDKGTIKQLPPHIETSVLKESVADDTACRKINGKCKEEKHDGAVDKQTDAVHKNRLATLDIFAGCGGLSDGLQQAGVSITNWAIEYEQPAGEAFKVNHPEALVFINNCNVILSLMAIMSACGDADDCISTPEAAELAAELDEETIKNFPRSGQVDFICGGPPCQVRFGVLQAGAYGMSQSRKRAFIWAASPEETLPEWPEPMYVFSGAPFRAITVRDTIGDLPAVGNGASVTTMEVGFSSPVCDAHFIFIVVPSTKGVKRSQNSLVPIGVFYLGFSDSYKFVGDIQHKHRQIGNAVPPPLAFALGRKLKEAVEMKASTSQRYSCVL
ncbi:DNA (cytosine-5)-methyltransferase [Citrus sinensis]|nr:DNA (cytosine-5)-methyltransferase [Citrus sinensis]